MSKMQHDEALDKMFEAVIQTIITAIHNREQKDKVASALYALLVREANTWRSIHVLRRHTPQELHAAFMVDAGTLLRAMFDAYLQAALIFRDPAKRVELATRYLEFEHVERYKISQKVLRHDNLLTNQLRLSQDRASEENRLQADFDRVKGAFLKGKGGQETRDKWYEDGLLKLATAAGREAEYDTFVRSFCGCVHSSAFSVLNGPMVSPDHVLLLASTFSARVAQMNVEYNEIDLGTNQLILDELCKSWLDAD